MRTSSSTTEDGALIEAARVLRSTAKVMDNLRKAIDGCRTIPANDGTGRTRQLRTTPKARSTTMDQAGQWAGAIGHRSPGSSVSVSLPSNFTKVEEDTRSILPKLCVFAPVC